MGSIPALNGIHHVKVAVSDLDAALDFYQRAFGASRIEAFDHRRESDGSLYAYICDVPGLGTLLELRLNLQRAASNRGFDFLTISVKDRTTLEAWHDHLTSVGAPHSEVITAIRAWVLVVEDPDGNRTRLYTLETHGPELKPDEANIWLAALGSC